MNADPVIGPGFRPPADECCCIRWSVAARDLRPESRASTLLRGDTCL